MKFLIPTTALAVLVIAGCIAGCAAADVASPSVEASPTATTAAPSTPPPTPTERPTPAPTATPAALCPAADETAYDANQIVLATANIFGAGREIGPAPGGGGRGSLPPMWPLPPGATSVEIVCAMGVVIPIRDTNIGNGAEGDLRGRTDITSFEGVSGIVHATNGMFLTGVFLTDAVPMDPAPERLDFSDGEAFESLAPLIGQTFFVGDGEGRRFLVPAGATRLFLGFADAAGYLGLPGWYGNNAGYLDVTVAINE